MSTDSALIWLPVALSELAALWLLLRLWRSDKHLVLKLSLSVIAPLPLFGPLVVLWIGCDFPPALPPALRDRRRRSADVFDRWRHIIEDRNPLRRFRNWRKLMTDARERP